jgi:hypothetical protein
LFIASKLAPARAAGKPETRALKSPASVKESGAFYCIEIGGV